jgi:hypothetical protein
LLDSRRIQATILRRDDAEETWRWLSVTEGADFVLNSVGFRVPLAHLYRGVTLDTE